MKRILPLLFVLTLVLCSCATTVDFSMQGVSTAFRSSEKTNSGSEDSSSLFVQTDSVSSERIPFSTDFKRKTEKTTKKSTSSIITDVSSETDGTSQFTDLPLDEATLTARAKEILETMSLEEKVGQLFLVRCPKSNAAEAVRTYHLGGLTLYSSNVSAKSASSIRKNIASCQEASEFPLLIAVDEEGGKVVRMSASKALRSASFPSMQDLYREGGISALKKDAKEKAEFLLSFGVNVNLAPVCDVSQNAEDYIFPRTLGKDAKTTASAVSAIVEQNRKSGIASCLKHFPGYGNNLNTHTGSSVDNRPLSSFRTSDFLPFSAGIDAGAEFVMISHNVVTAIDANHPASLSEDVQKILREELHFNGVIVSDDLGMDAIKNSYPNGEAAVIALQAGTDLLCTTDYIKQWQEVLDAVKRKKLTEERIDESVIRLLKVKLSLGLMQ